MSSEGPRGPLASHRGPSVGGGPRQEGLATEVWRSGAGVLGRGPCAARVPAGSPLAPLCRLALLSESFSVPGSQARPSGVCPWLGLPGSPHIWVGGNEPGQQGGDPGEGGPRPEQGPEMPERVAAPTAESPAVRRPVWAHDARRPCLQGASSLAGETQHEHPQGDSRVRRVIRLLPAGRGRFHSSGRGGRERPLRGGTFVQYVAEHSESW